MAWYDYIPLVAGYNAVKKTGILGPGQDDYNNLANNVYTPNPNAYNNTASGGAMGALNTNTTALGGLGAQGIGNQGLAAQQGALQSITNMANGNGPSLARANMQQGLAQSFGNLSNQAMSNQGNIGAGNSQRNLLNAQANASNAVTGQAGVASVAEQMGALQQQNTAAQGLTSGELSQGNLQASLLGQQAQNATSQAAIGQNDAQNQQALDLARANAQALRQGYQLTGLKAPAQQLQAGLNDAGQVVKTVGSIAGMAG